jgi:hypothetical protein
MFFRLIDTDACEWHGNFVTLDAAEVHASYLREFNLCLAYTIIECPDTVLRRPMSEKIDWINDGF